MLTVLVIITADAQLLSAGYWWITAQLRFRCCSPSLLTHSVPLRASVPSVSHHGKGKVGPILLAATSCNKTGWGDCRQRKKGISKIRICDFSLVKYLKELAAFEVAIEVDRKDCVFM